ncbi:MAG: hypothetical protein OXE81_06280 [Gammaproteobacteria bacterium]|nr:hypothetical protein [Gammaproteobacteria bacterium]MCY4277429.1 hypothetical protein [Gammaproteobacteria bacterium]
MTSKDYFIEIDPGYDVCADETFSSACANTRLPYVEDEQWDMLRPGDAEQLMTRLMAGYHRPTLARTIEILRDIQVASSGEIAFFHELLKQLTPRECHSFMESTESTPREMAALMRASQIRDAVLVNWINQYSSDPDWRDDEVLSVVYGDRMTVVNGLPIDREFAEHMRRRNQSST